MGHWLRHPPATPSSAMLEIGTEVVAHARAREVPVYPMDGNDQGQAATSE